MLINDDYKNNGKDSGVKFPCYVRVDAHGIPYLVAELAFALSTNKQLDGTDLFEEGSNFCSWCGRRVIRNA